MTRYRLDISYDGTGYAGWQVQPKDMTVQEKLETAVKELTGEEAKLHGSGRTDQGVHARRQVAHVDLEKKQTPSKFKVGLNALLPDDIRVLKIIKVSSDFHARKSVVSKEYRYFIWNSEILPPFLRNYRTHVKNKLDVALMKKAAAALKGNNDFAAFTANPNREVESTVRELMELKVSRKGSEIVIVARGTGFLYKMVRSLAGFLVRVGEGAEPPSEAAVILASKERTSRVPTARPQGLFLWNVKY